MLYLFTAVIAIAIYFIAFPVTMLLEFIVRGEKWKNCYSHENAGDFL